MGEKVLEGYPWQIPVSTEIRNVTWIPTCSWCVHSWMQEHTYMCISQAAPRPSLHALVHQGFQVVSEQLWPARHAQTCPGIFGIAEGSTDIQALLRQLPPPIPTILWELSLKEVLGNSMECLLVVWHHTIPFLLYLGNWKNGCYLALLHRKGNQSGTEKVSRLPWVRARKLDC